MSYTINTKPIYKALKDFQKTTVNFAYKRLQENGRFLVADEVGLGKTMVAKGIIAKTYDDLKNKKEKIKIVYITTNQSIASQNIETLKIGDVTTETTRLSLLVTKLDDSDNSKISFRSFTVGTSLELKGNSTGLKEEREFIIYLLKERGLIKHLWTSTLKDFFRQTASDIDTEKDFEVRSEFIDKYEKLIREKYPDIKNRISSNKDSSILIKELRKLLILANLQYLKPDLIILDEFQRFSKLLTDDSNEENEIIEALFSDKDSKTLLLSATPYKLLDCKNSEHYDEFYGLIKWLYHDKNKEVEELKKMFQDVDSNKDKIEKVLKKVMCRTERTAFSPDGMIEKKEIVNLKLKTTMKHFLVEYKSYNDLEIPNLTRYLKSSPSPINYMKWGRYKAKRDFNELEIDKSSFKGKNKHPKLKMLQQEVKNQSLKDYIWMPPLHPYVKTRGINIDNLSTKILIFSQWDFTPDSLVGAFSKSEQKRYKNYTNKKSFKDRDRLLEVTMQGVDPYNYEGILSFSKLITKTKKEYDLSEIEAKILLGSPANVIYRSILKYGQIEDHENLKFYIEPWDENKDKYFQRFSHLFLHYLGQKEIYEKLKIPKNDSHKLEKILDYSIKHNIQSMFDEYIHLLTDSPRYQNIKDDKDKILYLLENFSTIFMLRPNEITVDNIDEENEKLTSKFIMRISKSSMTERTDKEVPLTSDNIKTAFNSPFAPFVLATTSIGQEGLDFHPYCHQVWHWDLPSNPVDLEQREGRIHRYKNYAVRKNIVKCFDDRCWIEKFKSAKDDKKCDFKTFWLFSDSMKNANQKIERVVPFLPFSRDEQKYEQLINQVGLYRTAIGQKRQKESLINKKKGKEISLKPV